MPRTLLIADDDKAFLDMLQRELENRGFRVHTANNGQTALFLAKVHKPDLIILDVAMPMVSGIGVFESLRVTPETQEIPVIFLSGLPSAQVYPAIEKSVRAAHIKKPVDLNDLQSLINQFLPQ